MEEFIYCRDRKTFEKLVDKGFAPLKEDGIPFILLNNINDMCFEGVENISFSNTMTF